MKHSKSYYISSSFIITYSRKTITLIVWFACLLSVELFLFDLVALYLLIYMITCPFGGAVAVFTQSCCHGSRQSYVFLLSLAGCFLVSLQSDSCSGWGCLSAL